MIAGIMLALIAHAAFQAPATGGHLLPAQEGIIYGEASGETLSMDYYAPKGPGPHPIAIIIHGGGYQRGDSKSGSEAYCAQFLAPAGYAVFSINYRLAPKYPYPYMVYDVQRAVRFIRHNAKRWDADPHKLALVGGSAGGFLSSMVGLLNEPGDPKGADAVDRESAQAQAVVTLFAQSSFANVPLNKDVHALLDSLIAQKGLAEALRESAPITYATKDDPPFLLIQGDQDEYIPFAEDTNLQTALRNVGVRCDLIRIPGGKHGTGGWHKLPNVPDWEREMVEWLNARFDHQGEIGEGIRARQPAQAAALLGAQAGGAPKILVHGHRGARARKPENTLPAFQYALQAGVDALEMDMAVTKDGVIVISHDPILEPPVCSGPQGKAVIHTLTLEQVREWDCGRLRNPNYPTQEAIPGTRMPTLDEVFALGKEGNFDYNIETKSFPEKPEYTPAPDVFAGMVLDKIRQYKLEKRVIVQSFDFRTLVAMKKLAPEIRLSALTERDPRAFSAIAAEANADIISPYYKLVTPEKVAEAHAAHLQVVPWTVNTPEEWDKLIAAQVDAIISDDPAALIAYLKQRGLR